MRAPATAPVVHGDKEKLELTRQYNEGYKVDPMAHAIPGVDGFFRGIRDGIWRDMAGYGGIWRDTGRYREIPGDTRRYEIRADTGRYGEMRGDARRYGEIQSDMGEIHQDTAKNRPH